MRRGSPWMRRGAPWTGRGPSGRRPRRRWTQSHFAWMAIGGPHAGPPRPKRYSDQWVRIAGPFPARPHRTGWYTRAVAQTWRKLDRLADPCKTEIKSFYDPKHGL